MTTPLSSDAKNIETPDFVRAASPLPVAGPTSAHSISSVGDIAFDRLRYDSGPTPTTPLNMLRMIERVCQEVGNELIKGAQVRKDQDKIVIEHTEAFLEKFQTIAALRLAPEDRARIDVRRDLVIDRALLEGFPGDPVLTLSLRPSEQLIDTVLNAPTTLINRDDWNRVQQLCEAGKQLSFQVKASPHDTIVDGLCDFLIKTGMSVSAHDRELLKRFTIPRITYYDALYKSESIFTIASKSCTVAAQDRTELEFCETVTERWKDVPSFKTILSLLGGTVDSEYQHYRLADEVLSTFEEAKLPRNCWHLLKEPEFLLRYREFAEWYKKAAINDTSARFVSSVSPSKLRAEFIDALGMQTLYRAEAYLPEGVARAVTYGASSTYVKRFWTQSGADSKIQKLCERYGIVHVALSSVFRQDLGNGELIRFKGNTSFVDSVFLSSSSYGGYALGIARAYAHEAVRFARKQKTEMLLTSMEVPRFYAIDYANSVLFGKMANRTPPLTAINHYFRDTKSGEISSFNADASGGGEVLLRRIKPEWIKSGEIFPFEGPYYTDDESQIAGRLAGVVGEGVPIDLEQIRSGSVVSGVRKWVGSLLARF